MPVGGWGRPARAILPASRWRLPYAAYIAPHAAGLIDVYAEDYIRTAREGPLRSAGALRPRSAKRAVAGVELSRSGGRGHLHRLIRGGEVFTIPGMGTHVVESINNRDQSLILATVMVSRRLLASFNLIVDLLYGVIDPQVRVNWP